MKIFNEKFFIVTNQKVSKIGQTRKMTSEIFIKKKKFTKFDKEYHHIFQYQVFRCCTCFHVQTTLKITSWELMILLVMMFNVTCFTSDISQPVSYSVFLCHVRVIC